MKINHCFSELLFKHLNESSLTLNIIPHLWNSREMLEKVIAKIPSITIVYNYLHYDFFKDLLPGYMSNIKSKSQGRMPAVRASVPSSPTPFPQVHFTETQMYINIYQLLKDDLPFAEVMATIQQNNIGKLVRKSKLPFYKNVKKYTGKL